MSKNMMLVKSSKIVSVLLVFSGIILILMPNFYSLSTLPPSFPWIPENYYSQGELDYINPKSGKYYLAVIPKSEHGVSITVAKVTFEDLGEEFYLVCRNIIEDPAYDQYNFWWETDVISDGLQFNMKYTITFYVEDAKGRSHQVSSWVTFIPKELLPLPEGYFLINQEEALFDSVIKLQAPELTITFVPTGNEEYITHVAVEVYKDETLIETIPTINIPDYYPSFQKQTDGTWQAEYILPSHGDFLFEGFVGTTERSIKLMSVTIDYTKEILISNIMWTASGVILIVVGVFVGIATVKIPKRR